MYRLKIIFLLLLINTLLNACSGGDSDSGGGASADGGGGGSQSANACTNVHIVNLAQNSKSGLSCTRGSSNREIADCVEAGIRHDIPAACMGGFDVFVPGTNAENGAWKSFNSMFSRDTGRAYLSLKYQDNIDDSWKYDQGVEDANDSLKLLLYTLQNRFSNADIRVFGHSKGSHPVALVADDSNYSRVKFFAFAQPGRTNKNIDGLGGLAKGKLGAAGYIHKLGSNLVGISWENDEVRYYKGSGLNGLKVPEKWGWPGYISQKSTNGTYTTESRIDHHDNYGGHYTNGLPQNRLSEGDGTTAKSYPYCPTGNKKAWGNPLCNKKTVEYFPYFWGDEDCRNITFDIMDTKATGYRHYIGNSGPRAAGCSDNVGAVRATYRLDYRINPADQGDCRYNMTIKFKGLNYAGQPYIRSNGGSIEVSHSQDTGWTYKTGTVNIPYHTRLNVKAVMVDIATGFKSCLSLAASEGYIKNLKVTFTHPGSGKKVTKTLIGLGEGSSYPYPAFKLAGKNNVAWENINAPGILDTWDLFYANINGGTLMIKGATDGGRNGEFYKPLHLID